MTTGYSDEQIWDMAVTFLRDDKNKNLLLRSREFSRKDYDLAKDMTLSMWDTLPPIGGGSTVSDIPLHILIRSMAAWLLQSESFLQIRNQVTMSSDHNEAVGLDDKGPLYAQFSAQLRQQVEFEMKQVKTALNMQRNGFRHISSGYRYTGRRY